jgi:DNA invertase Pin-like site-specific DNA recombinase
MSRLGYSYLRYSSPQQGDGDSVRRQTKLAAEWCKCHGVTLDTHRAYQDHGRSAYHGRHRKAGGALAAFLAEVEAGQIPAGSVLIVENLDRLSRENPWDAVPLLCNIVNAGISVVTLSPSETLYERGRDLTALVLAVVEFGRGHSESESKARRMAEVWGERRRRTREEGAVMTGRLPAWIEERGGKLRLVPSRAAVVRRMFQMALEGKGLTRIVGELKGTPAWGRSGAWSKAYVHKILSGEAVLGVYQPTRGGKPDGDPLPHYFPQVVDEVTWDRVQVLLAGRKDKRGPVGKKVATLFGGLLWDARTRGRMQIAWQTRGPKGKRSKRRVLVPAGAMEGREACVSFPNEVFEGAVLRLLSEVSVKSVLGKEPAGDTGALAAELAAVEARLRQLEEALQDVDEDAPTLARVVARLDERRRSLQKKHAEARQKEASPQAAAWAEARTLFEVAKDEATRLRLRDLLRQIIDEVRVLVVPRRSHRLCAVQVFFKGDGHRDYLIHYQAAGYNRPGGCWARSLNDVAKLGTLDLRRPEDTAQLEEALLAVPLEPLLSLMQAPSPR